MSEQLRIALDLRPSGWLGGLYYLRNLVAAVQTLPTDEQPDLVGLVPLDDGAVAADAFDDLLTTVPYQGAASGGIVATGLRNRIRPLIASADAAPFGVERAAAASAADVVFPSFKRTGRDTASWVPWVADLQHLRFPENFSATERLYRTLTFARVARRSNVIVVSSEAVAREFLARFPQGEGKLRVLRFTTVLERDWLRDHPRSVAERYGLPRDFLLFPGQFWLHKNHRLAFEAVKVLRKQRIDVCLACTGATADYRHPNHFAELERFLDDHALREHVRILGVVPRRDYVGLLRAARAVVQTSLFEGWSSVVEDARALGRPMILSDIDVHVEQDPRTAVYFPRLDVEALAARMREAVTSRLEGVPEREAVGRQRTRIAAYARTFVSIAEESVEARRSAATASKHTVPLRE